MSTQAHLTEVIEKWLAIIDERRYIVYFKQDSIGRHLRVTEMEFKNGSWWKTNREIQGQLKDEIVQIVTTNQIELIRRSARNLGG